MLEQSPEPRESPPLGNSPDGDLALAYFGSVGVGTVSPLIPAVLLQHWGLIVPMGIAGAGLGVVWGILAVIVAAAAGCEYRRSATLWMFAIQATCMGVLTLIYRVILEF